MDDLTGKKYGRLTVLSYSHSYQRKAHWLCKCTCGEEKVIRGQSLKTGNTSSCGCLHKEIGPERYRTHGFSDERLYRIYAGMKTRCTNENHHSYFDYGRRGIKIDADWANDFVKFRTWALNNGYSDDLTIERNDADGDYCPSNCTWIPGTDQAKNRRSSTFIEFQDLTMTPTEFSDAFAIPYSTVIRRLGDGWLADRILAKRW